jgi:hypothetical protein
VYVTTVSIIQNAAGLKEDHGNDCGRRVLQERRKKDAPVTPRQELVTEACLLARTSGLSAGTGERNWYFHYRGFAATVAGAIARLKLRKNNAPAPARARRTAQGRQSERRK